MSPVSVLACFRQIRRTAAGLTHAVRVALGDATDLRQLRDLGR